MRTALRADVRIVKLFVVCLELQRVVMLPNITARALMLVRSVAHQCSEQSEN